MAIYSIVSSCVVEFVKKDKVHPMGIDGLLVFADDMIFSPQKLLSYDKNLVWRVSEAPKDEIFDIKSGNTGNILS